MPLGQVDTSENHADIFTKTLTATKPPLIGELQSKHPYSPFSEVSKQMIHTLGNAEGFEFVRNLCQKSMSLLYEKLDGRTCLVRLRYLSSSHRCNTEIKQREVRRLDNPPLHDKERREPRCSSERALKKDSNQSLSAFRRVKSFEARRRTSDGRRLNDLAQEGHSHVATRQERERYEKEWKIGLHSKRLVGQIRSRADFPAALRMFREAKQEAAEAGHQFNPTIRPDLQVRQRREQQLQHNKDRHRNFRYSYKQCGTICCMVS